MGFPMVGKSGKAFPGALGPPQRLQGLAGFCTLAMEGNVQGLLSLQGQETKTCSPRRDGGKAMVQRTPPLSLGE